MSQSRAVWPRTQLALRIALALSLLSCDVPKELNIKRDAGDAAPTSDAAHEQADSATTGTAHPTAGGDEQQTVGDDEATSTLKSDASTDVGDAHANSGDTSAESLDASYDGTGANPDDLTDTADQLCGGAEFTIAVTADGAVHVRCNGQDIIVVEPRGDDAVTGHEPVDDEADDDPTNTSNDDTDTDPSAGESDAGLSLSLCRPVDATEHQILPARAQAMSANASSSSERAVLVTDLYDKFRGWCGSCHVDFGLGGLQVNFSTFQSKVTDKVIEQMRKSDPTKVMPPGKLFTDRPEEDPVVQLYQLLKTWRAAADEAERADQNAVLKVFFLPAEEASSDVSPYVMSPALGASLTNIGNCIPDAALVNSENVKSKTLDDMFAAATTLPKSLRDTDLFTLESAELARYGVIGYAPTYPLFSDDAGKMRQLRVPRGTSVEFDKATQSFKIPPNTRFYKTFLKRVTDKDGNVNRWRKMETRLIVARPNVSKPNGAQEPTALYGTYRWDDDEKEARLVEDPLRDGSPFRDVVFQYLTDEVHGAELMEQGTPDLGADLMTNGWGRYYGIPGSQRCVDCHRGSDSGSFILGFGPLQANRLPMDEDPNDGVEQHLHGIFEAPGPDELSQLQRLIDYGIVTGISQPTDEHEVYPLELTQDLPPRTEYELTAQGYMVGNCAFCHNPNGLASYENPVLRDILDFYPDSDGGIFGFPLTGDKAFSPRILRQDGMMRIPYVSPEMQDRQLVVNVDHRAGLLAPWRSLIYRNVDTPFTYVDDGALFPKMPLHVPGYDSRLRKIMGEWMASLPAREVAISATDKANAEQTYEEVFEGEADFEQALSDAEARLVAYRASGRYGCVDFVECQDDPVNCTTPCVDTRDIVSHDVLSALRTGQGDFAPPNYPRSPAAGIPERAHWVNTDLTEPKLDHWEPRRADWPDVLLVEQDPVAPPGGAYPSATASASTSAPSPSASTSASTSASGVASADASGSSSMSAAALRVIPSALEVWSAVGAGGSSETTTPLPSTPPSTSSSASDESTEPPPPDPDDPSVIALQAVRDLRLTDDFKELALGERPMWYWETEGHDCEFAPEWPTAVDYKDQGNEDWLDDAFEADLDRPLYLQSPGEAVFTNICANCHGPQADSKGRQATTVALMSGGETRVANLRDGLFGPANIETQFGPFAQEAGVTPQDLAVRYVAWMALGGTQRRIPAAILELVGRTKVYGQLRPVGNSAAQASPNMLEAAARMCSGLLPDAGPAYDTKIDLTRGLLEGAGQQFVLRSGDHAMWYDLCTYDNPQPLVVLSGIDPLSFNAEWGSKGFFANSYVRRVASDGRPTVPEDWPLGNQRGETVAGLTPDNTTPWCIEMPPSDGSHFHDASVFAGWWEHEHGEFPWCPADVLGERGNAYRWSEADRKRFSTRGAANAGMAVFTYLQAVIQQGLAPRPAFNRCEDR